MKGRRRARERVLQALYQMDVTHRWSREGRNIPGTAQGGGFSQDAEKFFCTLADGVVSRREDIDRLIEKYAEHWKMDRMPVVDRNILRMAIYELQNFPDIPAKVVINEAVELGKRYNSDDSASFINALLDRIAKEELRRDPEKEP